MADLIDGRENWGSRVGFILAAVGSAVGLGNIWRFPHECYSNGGSAFLIPYIVAMMVIGIPLLIMEFSLGHFTQQATPNAFKRVGKKWEFVGWWPIVLSFIIVTYYAVVLAWCLSYLLKSFETPLPWTIPLEDATKDPAHAFFFEKYLQFTGNFNLGKIRWEIVGSLALIWTLMYVCIFKGVKLVGKIVLWTVPIPWIMLLILTIRGLTLPGAMAGLEYYLEPDWSRLSDPKVWAGAFGQVFFSMTIAFGVMVTYASFLHRKSDLNNNALIIGLADLATSFIAGIAVFSTMGAMAAKTGLPVHEVVEDSESLGLAFVAFPKALGELPYAHAFSIVFFVALLLLGIDSAFSITEASLASLLDKTGWRRAKTLAWLSVVGFVIGIVFATQGGLLWFDAVDSAVNEGTLGIMFVGLVECLVLGWAFDISKLRAHANRHSDWKIGVWWEWMIKLVIPCILAVLIGWRLNNEVAHAEGGYLVDPDGKLVGTTIFGLCIMAIVLLVAVVLALWQPKGTKPTVGRLIMPFIPPLLIGIYLIRRMVRSEGGFLIDEEGNIIGATIFGLCLMVIVFLVALILVQWRAKASQEITEPTN